jgi:hypothetical protein
MFSRKLNLQIVFGLLAVVACIIVSVSYGYAQKQSQKGILQEQLQPGILRISPSELFTGELERLKPHLGLTGTGCVKVDYQDSEIPIGTQLELWHNGTAKIISKEVTTSRQLSEVSISVKEMSDAKETSKYQAILVISGQTGYSSSTLMLDIPALGTTQKQISKTIDIKKDTKPVAVWALLRYQGNSIVSDSTETIEEAAKQAESALVLKISQDKPAEQNKTSVR